MPMQNREAKIGRKPGNIFLTWRRNRSLNRNFQREFFLTIVTRAISLFLFSFGYNFILKSQTSNILPQFKNSVSENCRK